MWDTFGGSGCAARFISTLADPCSDGAHDHEPRYFAQIKFYRASYPPGGEEDVRARITSDKRVKDFSTAVHEPQGINVAIKKIKRNIAGERQFPNIFANLISYVHVPLCGLDQIIN